MKKLILIIPLFLCLFMLNPSVAQESARGNIVKQPIWGPVGYDYVEYYYIPEFDAYYNVHQQKFIYLENNKWVKRSSLSKKHRGYDMYRVTKFVINEPQPYLHHQKHKAIYGSESGHQKQVSIRDSRDSKYYVNRKHPEHSNWKNKNKKQNRQWNSRKEK